MYGRIFTILKRDNTLEDFDISRLTASIVDAIKAVNEYDEREDHIFEIARRLAFKVARLIDNYVDNNGCVHIDRIYDTVADTLFDVGYHETGKRYLKTRYENIILEKDTEISILKTKLKEYSEEMK